jgi:hypothetical protein
LRWWFGRVRPLADIPSCAQDQIDRAFAPDAIFCKRPRVLQLHVPEDEALLVHQSARHGLDALLELLDGDVDCQTNGVTNAELRETEQVERFARVDKQRPPIPTHKTRLAERGRNASQRLTIVAKDQPLFHQEDGRRSSTVELKVAERVQDIGSRHRKVAPSQRDLFLAAIKLDKDGEGGLEDNIVVPKAHEAIFHGIDHPPSGRFEERHIANSDHLEIRGQDGTEVHGTRNPYARTHSVAFDLNHAVLPMAFVADMLLLLPAQVYNTHCGGGRSHWIVVSQSFVD